MIQHETGKKSQVQIKLNWINKKERTEEMMHSFPKLKGLGVERISQLYVILSILVGLTATEDGHSIIMTFGPHLLF